MDAFDIKANYLHVMGENAKRVDMTPTFWQELFSGQRAESQNGWLMSAFMMEKDLPMWELHHNGEEVLVMMSGNIDVIFEIEGQPRTLTLGAGQACVVPRKTWHTIKVKEPGQLLALSFVHGTEHRPV
jgi:mannose-6-phosphate isomerase-like protein (cupin superfamily)